MDNLDFLRDSEPGNATAIIKSRSGLKHTITNLNLQIIRNALPLLAACFEDREQGPFYCFEREPPEVAVSLLRYCYLHEYTFCESQIDKPCSLLLHLELYRLSEHLGAGRLQNLARLHVIRETELSCSTGEVVIDLCDAIRLLYSELCAASDLKEIIANYCVSCFRYHRLGESEAFRQTVFESPQFHKDLLRVNMQRGFQDEAAVEIMNLSSCQHSVHEQILSSTPSPADFMCQLHLNGSKSNNKGVSAFPKGTARGEPNPQSSGIRFNLPTRTKRQLPLPPSTIFGGDDEFDDFLDNVSVADSDCTIISKTEERDDSESIGWSSDSDFVAIGSNSSTTALLGPMGENNSRYRERPQSSLGSGLPFRTRPTSNDTPADQGNNDDFELLFDDVYSSDSDWSVVAGPSQSRS